MQAVIARDTIHTKHERLHYLDWFRVLVVVGVFYAHTIYIFDLLYWHIGNEQRTSSLDLFVVFGSRWGMSLLFLLSGASNWFALRSQTGGQFLRERFARLLIPFLLGFVLLAPPLAYIEALAYSQKPGSFFQFYLSFFESMQVSWNPQWLAAYGYHLWFLVFLFFISVISLPLLMYLRRERGQCFVQRLAALSARPGGLFVFFLPIVLIQVTLYVPFPGYQSWGDFFSWLLFFVYGYILFSEPRFAQAIRKQWKLALFVGITSYLASTVWDMAGFLDTWKTSPSYSAAYILYQTLQSLATWSWLIFILYFGMRFLNISNKVIRYGNEAILPFYVLHYPVIFISVFYVGQLDIGMVAKFLIVSTCSFLVTLALYELFIRRINVMRRLFGMKPRTQVAHEDMAIQKHSA
jgi:glucans biosynthesis protein C